MCFQEAILLVNMERYLKPQPLVPTSMFISIQLIFEKLNKYWSLWVMLIMTHEEVMTFFVNYLFH